MCGNQIIRMKTPGAPSGAAKMDLRVLCSNSEKESTSEQNLHKVST